MFSLAAEYLLVLLQSSSHEQLNASVGHDRHIHTDVAFPEVIKCYSTRNRISTMRLQLSIHRNALPPAHIIFTTGTGPSSHTKSHSGSTIADLLHDANDLVPLESADGEWGLEDYIVEVAATADQEALYECLHFQTLDSVLRDDDEVIIRGLESEELRSRRLGGRLQITGDGRHLIDGVAFGKRWIRKQERPGIVIPPRKKRRILATEEDDSLLVDQSQPLRAITAGDESDEEEDGDFEDKENIDYEKAVTVRGDFDDADEESEEESAVVEEDEIQLLLKDAAELDEVDADEEEQLVEMQLKARTRLGKRKRDVVDDGYDESVFEGFSSPAKPSRNLGLDLNQDEEDELLDKLTSKLDFEPDPDGMDEEIAAEQTEQIGANILGSDDDAETSDSSFDSDSGELSHQEKQSSADSKAESEEEDALQAHSPNRPSRTEKQREKKKSTSPQKASKKLQSKLSLTETDDSDSETSDLDDSVVSTSSSITESDFTSSSGSSESDSESDTDGGKKTSQLASVEFASKLENFQATSSSDQTVVAQVQQQSKSSSQPLRESAPGEGLTRTHKKNERIKRQKRLAMLKEAGELPAHANFSHLHEYDEAQSSEPMSSGALVDDLEAARARLLNGMQEVRDLEVPGKLPILETSQSEVQAKKDVDMPEVDVGKPVTIVESTAVAESTSESSAPKRSSTNEESGPKVESPAKRAKLDVAASRRMLFGSLGLRTPKTPAEEQALRDKLASSVRPGKVASAKNNLDQVPTTEAANEVPTESWKDKLIVSAVECVKEGVVLPPPPFPFEQNWHKKGKASRDQSRASSMSLEDVSDYTTRQKIRRLLTVIPSASIKDCYRALEGKRWVYDDAADHLFLLLADRKEPSLPIPDDQALHYDGSVSPPANRPSQTAANGFAPDMSTIGVLTMEDEASNPESRTLSFEKEADGMPIPTDFTTLVELHRSHITKGTIIAYKEIHVGAETNFQPEVSPYRVAEVDSVDEDGMITVILSIRDRTKKVYHGPDTAGTISNNFEINGSQDEDDDGIRELEFAFMLEPKFVEAAKVQVPESTAPSSLRGGDAEAASQLEK